MRLRLEPSGLLFITYTVGENSSRNELCRAHIEPPQSLNSCNKVFQQCKHERAKYKVHFSNTVARVKKILKLQYHHYRVIVQANLLESNQKISRGRTLTTNVVKIQCQQSLTLQVGQGYSRPRHSPYFAKRKQNSRYVNYQLFIPHIRHQTVVWVDIIQ